MQRFGVSVTMPAILAVLLSSVAVAQTNKEAVPFVFHAEATDLPTLVDRCAIYLQRNILFTPEEMPKGLPQQVMLQQPIATDRKGCEDFLSQLVARAGYMLTYVDQEGKVMEIISLHGPRQAEIQARAYQRTVEEVLARPNLRVPVLVHFQLQHTNATLAQNSLRPFFATNSSHRGSLTIGMLGNDSTLLLMGAQDVVVQALRTLQAADMPSERPSLEWNHQLQLLMKKVEALQIRLDALAPTRADK